MKRFTALIRGVAVVMITLGVGSLGRALADAAPPQPPPGTTIESGYEATKVRMVSENVLMTIQDDQAVVEATFQMRNQGTAAESFKVRFPLGADDGYGTVQRISDFSAYVDGKLAAFETENQPYTQPYCTGCPEEILPWATWPVSFPPGETVSLGVSYVLEPQSLYSRSLVAYDYMLETGAGWYGTIGEGTITARFPYPVSDATAGFLPSKTLHPQASGTDIVWHFEDMEPERGNNIWFSSMNPRLWRAEQAALIDVEAHPDSLDAHLAAARAITAALPVNEKHGLLDVSEVSDSYNRAVDEYQYVLGKMPDNPAINLEYFELVNLPWPRDSAVRCPAFEKALALNPDDKTLNEIVPYITKDCEQALATKDVAVAPTTTSGPKASDILTLRAPTPTARPAVTPTVVRPPETVDKPESGSDWPIIAAGVIVVLGIGGWLIFRAKSGAH